MSLVGKSLHDMRKARPSEHFTMGTAIGTAIQTLEAIEELHSIGYLHRDIKPGNYSTGQAEQRGELRKIYILDFGMCRRYIKPDGVMRRPRTAAAFRGTPRYAALRCYMVSLTFGINFKIHQIFPHLSICRIKNTAGPMTSNHGST
jgi:tau tubulin kinase